MALAHFRKTFLARVVKQTYLAIYNYLLLRKLKLSYKERGDRGHIKWLKLLSCRRIWDKRSRKIHQRGSLSAAADQFNHYTMTLAVATRLKMNIKYERWRDRVMKLAVAYRLFYVFNTSFRSMQRGCVWSKSWKVMNVIATRSMLRLYKSKYFFYLAGMYI
jgi:hypothetical protein